MENVSPEYQKYFHAIGVTDNDLKNHSAFIYQFIETHGGIHQAMKEIDRLPSDVSISEPFVGIHPSNTAPPTAAPPLPPNRTLHRTPAPLPPLPKSTPAASHTVLQHTSAAAAPPPPAPPPPPPPPPPPSTLFTNSSNESNTVSSQSQSIPPPPPPPPMPSSLSSNSGTEDSKLATSSLQQQNLDPRAALMQAIKSGPKLNRVDTESLSSAKLNKTEDCRDALLSQIRKGVELRPVEINAEKPAPAPVMGGIAGALVRALEERSRALAPTDDSSSSSSDDDEWGSD